MYNRLAHGSLLLYALLFFLELLAVSDPRCSLGVPKTGQMRKYISSDDGDLRIGKPWPKPRYKENKNGTVTDRLSGLTWTRNADKANGVVDWEQAVSGATACADGGFTDWRLPNRNELESLVDLGRYHPALPEGHPFTGVQSSYYWTSTTPANNDDHAWVIHFYIGMMTHDDKGGSHYVWYVRGGQQETDVEPSAAIRFQTPR